MKYVDRNKQAERIARKYFADGRTIVSFADVQRLLGITESTWWNYAGYLKNAGLVTSATTPGGGRKHSLRITEKGLAVLEKAPEQLARTGRPPKADVQKITPQDLQDHVDRYNQGNPAWRFILVPERFAPEEFKKEVTSRG